ENIYFTLKNAGDFKTLIKAVEAAGMVDTLKGSGPFTMFAPTDAAFAKLPAGELENLFKPENKETLKAILAYHVLPEKVMSAELAALREAKTLKRTKLKIDNGGGLKIDGAAVVRQDIVTSNGVIHVIDTLLKPN
ncbi:MAG TPA: fasciclin domain-containing protein, partial [Pyrinomonadaceae bacterium]|nr:fasciclin domain-containing protein [Pyrinomonadaceae bacterium]